MTKPTPTLGSVEHPHSRASKHSVDSVDTTAQHHTCDEAEIMRTLVNAVATGNRDAVFAIASRLVDGTHAVVAQVATVEDKWLTPGEAAVYANVSRMTIWRWRNERGLAFTKVGAEVRIRSAELQKFMEQHKSG